MKVFKFGGASVKDAQSIKNLANIVKNYTGEPLIVVISAMGKSTNKLERITESYFHQDGAYINLQKEFRAYHLEICEQLFGDNTSGADIFYAFLEQLDAKLQLEPSLTYNFEYDQVVSFGELLSTSLISSYLNSVGIENTWVDIRKVLRTNNKYREAEINFELSEELVRKTFETSRNQMYVTQGFIASTSNNLTTTLGREGSDYSGALLAYFQNSGSYTVWKDVPGILNADPKWFDDTELIETMNYTDAIELAFYGASVIHPKTIQPLKKKSIPLYVRSFLDIGKTGTVIQNKTTEKTIPSFIFKVDQVLLEINPVDLTFIDEQHLQHVFSLFSKYGLKINFMQNTAVNFKVCTNNNCIIINQVAKALGANYTFNTQQGLELITIRYYDTQTIERVLVEKEVLLEHRSQNTIQMVVRPLNN